MSGPVRFREVVAGYLGAATSTGSQSHEVAVFQDDVTEGQSERVGIIRKPDQLRLADGLRSTPVIRAVTSKISIMSATARVLCHLSALIRVTKSVLGETICSMKWSAHQRLA